MNRMTAAQLALAVVLVLAPATARAQAPVLNNNTLVSGQPTTDAATSASSWGGLRAWLGDLLQSRTWLSASSAPVPTRTTKAARLRRALSTRTQIWVP